MSEEPYFKIHAFVCTNQRDADDPRGSCAGRGSTELRDYLKKKAKMAGLLKGVRINNAGCLDRCELGPVMVIYPEGVWYGMDSKEDIDEILETHLVKGERVERLLLKPEDRQRSRPMHDRVSDQSNTDRVGDQSNTDRAGDQSNS